MIDENIMNNQTRVCHVTSAHPRYDPRIFYKECRSLAKHDFDVVLLVNDYLPDETLDSVKIKSTRFAPQNRYERMIKSKKHIKKLMLEIDADIYHFHDPELMPEAAWIKRKGKKVIFDFHEDVPQQILFKEWLPQKIRKIISIFYCRYEKKKAKNFDALISVTPKIVERLKSYNLNTIMITNFPIVRNRNIEKKSRRKRAICFAGGITPQWNHENIIKSIEVIEDVEYILAGSGPQDYLDELKKLNGWNKVRFLSRISHEEVMNIYDESMVGMALMSKRNQVGGEGTLGNTKLFEFMEAGIPVVCSNNKIWEQIINNSKCGKTINPESVAEISQAITQIISNPELASQMGDNGKNAVFSKYNWATQEKILIDLYESIA